MKKHFTKFAFTESVKKEQEKYGTRKAYARMEESAERYVLTDKEITFIRSRDSFYMATTGENGWPYVQHRGGAKGFVNVLDETTLAYADFRGNGQYISTGNIKSSNKTTVLMMDYPSKKRLKLWAKPTIYEAGKNIELEAQLLTQNYQARIERIVILKIQAYDWNCPQHITPRYTEEEISLMQQRLV